jgi:hypothetical protein
MPGRIGFPGISTPNRGTDVELRAWQQAVNNVRERIETLESLLGAATQRATVSAASATSVAALERQVRQLAADAQAFVALSSLFNLGEVFEEGDQWVYDATFSQFFPRVPREPEQVLPLVNGDVPPALVYLQDGSLVYFTP